MKKIIVVSFLFIYSGLSAQDYKEVKLDDLKTPNSPGFQILDISPSSIEKPTNPKEFALKAFNLASSGTALPKNFAFEIAPYWYVKPAYTNVYKYLNIKYADPSTSKTHNNIATGIYNKLSVSLASSFNDSTAATLLKNTNYISFGVRTNILTLRSGKQHKTLNTIIEKISNRLGELSDDLDTKENDLDSRHLAEKDPRKKKILEDSIDLFTKGRAQLVAEAAEKDVLYKSYTEDSLTELSIPVFQLDAAYAYSEAFADNEYSAKRFNRSGLWVTATLSSNNLALTILGKVIWDNVLTDTTNNIFTKKNAADFGGKLDWTIGKNLSLGIEYVSRNYTSNEKYLNSKRTVGIIQYKVNSGLYLTGTYGKNFGKINNVFALFGINWGFGNSHLPIP